MIRWRVRITLTCEEERGRFGTESLEGIFHSAYWQDAAMRLYRQEARYRRGDRNPYIPIRITTLDSGDHEVTFGYPAAQTVVMRSPGKVEAVQEPRVRAVTPA